MNNHQNSNVSEQLPKINSTRAHLLHNYIPINVNNHKVLALVDSGADVSIASSDVIEKYGLHNNISECDKKGIELPNSQVVPIRGLLNVSFTVDNQSMSCKFYLVENISPEWILGIDWLSTNNVTINFGSKQMTIDTKRQLTTACSTTIPPHSEKLILARIRGPVIPDGVMGTTTPSPAIHSTGLLSAKVLTAVKDGTVIQRVANMSDNPVQLIKGSSLGKFNCMTNQDALYPLADEPSDSTAQPDTPDMTSPPSQHINIDESCLSSEQKSQLQKLADQYSDIFVQKNTQLGKCDIIKHKITVDPGQPPLRQRAYRLRPDQKDIMDNTLQEMLEGDIIEGSTSPWAAPCMLVAKRNGSGYRFVVDYRRLNNITQLDAHPLPSPNEALESLGVSNPAWFSTLDLQNGFYQVVIDENSRPYTAFRSHAGLYQFKRLPQGLKGSPSTFQRVMEAVMRGLTWKFCLIYLDDIIVFSRTFNEHISHLRQVFDRLRAANLKLKPSKCFFAKREISYLGHVVNNNGIHPDPGKVSAVSEFPTPNSLKELRAFLGLSGYYRRFIQDYAKIAHPLYNLTKKDVKFTWTDECQHAFEKLKNQLVQAPALGYPDMTAPFRLYSDSSDTAVGAVLCQKQDGVERVISYAGRALDKAQRNYGITEKECFALIFAIKQFDCYLRASKFTAVVDHMALKWLLSLKEPSGRLMRWTMLVQAYDFNVEYKPGRHHGNADALSRRAYTHTENDNDFLGAIQLPDTDHDDNNTSDSDDNDGDNGDENEVELEGDNSHTDTPVSMEQLAVLQSQDPFFKDIIIYLQTDTLPQNKNRRRDILSQQCDYFLHDNILHHVWIKGGKGHRRQRTHLQVCIPRSLVPIVLRDTHDAPLTGCHLGFARTIEKTKMRYFWPRMSSDIITWVKTCDVCMEKKRPKNPVKAQISAMPSSEPFERISTDILGPLPTCNTSGNRYVLVFVDSFTKYVELIPLINIRAATVARAFLHRIICRHGAPRFLHSDRGTNYLSQLVKETCKLLNITKTQTTSYHPSCNGQSERMMSFITTSLSKYISGPQDRWDELLPFIQFAYNTTPCLDSTEYTPYFLVHGRHPVMPSDSALAPPLNVSRDTSTFIAQLLSNLEASRSAARNILQERRQAMVESAKSKANHVNFQVGDVVFLYTPVVAIGNSAKLTRPWVGPYYIVEKLSNIHCKLRRKDNNVIVKNRVHINRLKHGYIRPDQPDDTTPPEHGDATEPAVLGEAEIPPQRDAQPPPHTSTHRPNPAPRHADSAPPTNETHDKTYDIEKILRKSYKNGVWKYRVKWRNFDQSQNTWITFEDLDKNCQQLVKDIHKTIPTDRKSSKKQ